MDLGEVDVFLGYQGAGSDLLFVSRDEYHAEAQDLIWLWSPRPLKI